VQYLEARPWNYSKNKVGQLVNGKQVPLTGSPVFLRLASVDNNFPREPKFRPNPVTNGIGVYEFWMFEDSSANILLYDSGGRLVQTIAADESLIEGPHARFIDLSGYPAGTYFIQLSTPYSNQTVKLVKQG